MLRCPAGGVEESERVLHVELLLLRLFHLRTSHEVPARGCHRGWRRCGADQAKP